ncbi:MAG: hypothetical protein RI932_1879 [Pseudomonadota bacterium]|jgi:hypothetical protein
MPVFSSLRLWSSAQVISIYGLTSLVVCPSLSAEAFTFTTSALGGYEVLSYRDDPTNLTGGAVSAGDAYEQASFKGPQFGVSGYAGFATFDGIEPIAGVEILASQLKKSASSEGYTTEGSFNFVNGSIGAGARAWLSESFSLGLVLGLSQAFSNEMKTSKKSDSGTGSIGELDFKFTSHKRTTLQLAAAFSPAAEGLLLGLDLRLGSGCFSCSSPSTPEQQRSYVTRSGALTVAWMLGGTQMKPPSPQFNEKLKKVAPRRPVQKKPSLPQFEDDSDE